MSKAVLPTILTMEAYEVVLWVWFTASPNTTFPGIAVVPLVLLVIIVRTLFGEPGTAVGALAVGGFSLIIWTAIFHVAPAFGVYKFWKSVADQRPAS